MATQEKRKSKKLWINVATKNSGLKTIKKYKSSGRLKFICSELEIFPYSFQSSIIYHPYTIDRSTCHRCYYTLTWNRNLISIRLAFFVWFFRTVDAFSVRHKHFNFMISCFEFGVVFFSLLNFTRCEWFVRVYRAWHRFMLMRVCQNSQRLNILT